MTYGGIFCVVAGILVVTGVAAAKKTTPARPVENVTSDPEALANAAGVSLAIYALARALASEELPSRIREKTAIAWVIRNHAAHVKKTIPEVILAAAGVHAGVFGPQYQGRFVSSAQVPTAEDLRVAAEVLRSNGPDPTRGSMQYDHPRTQDAAKATGRQGYKVDAAALALIRAETNDLIIVDGVDPRRLRFWRPRSATTTGVA